MGACGTPEEIRQAHERFEECHAKNHCDENGNFYDNIVFIPYVGGGLSAKVITQCGNCGTSYDREPTLEEIDKHNRDMKRIRYL